MCILLNDKEQYVHESFGQLFVINVDICNVSMYVVINNSLY